MTRTVNVTRSINAAIAFVSGVTPCRVWLNTNSGSVVCDPETNDEIT